MDRIFFLTCAGFSVAGALLVILLANPVHSALALVLTLLATAGLFLLAGAQFLAVIQVLVYAGAIMVLFVFVIMMLNLHRDEMGEELKRTGRFPAFLLGGMLLVELAAATAVLLPGGTKAEYANEAALRVGHSQALGLYLFTGYAFPFEIASILLLVAILGAVVLSRGRGR